MSPCRVSALVLLSTIAVACSNEPPVLIDAGTDAPPSQIDTADGNPIDSAFPAIDSASPAIDSASPPVDTAASSDTAADTSFASDLPPGPAPGTPDAGVAPRTGEGLFRLVQRRTFAAPVANGRGITFDGKYLWIMAGGHNGAVHTLNEVDPATGALRRQFTYDNLIEQPGSGAFGITFDGRSLWISVSGNTNKLVEVEPLAGKITRTWSSPSTLGPSDLDFDGKDLWLSTGTGDLFLLDGVTGGVKRHLPTTFPSKRDHGIAFRTGELWVGNLFGGMDVQDPITGQHLGNVPEADPTDGGSSFETGSMVFVGGDLVVLNSRGVTYFEATRVR